MDIKKILADSIDCTVDGVNFYDLIIPSISADKGDYCLPCFTLSKALKQNPMKIAEDIANSIKSNDYIAKAEVVAGYVNFFLNKAKVTEEIIGNFDINDIKSNEGKGKVVCIDYCSPNLAKYLHIGHLKTLIIGESLARLFENYGYTVKRLNFIGDYGTPFGKILGGIEKWGSIEDVRARGNDALQDYYVKFNQMEEKDESYTQLARDIFKKIEDKDPTVYPLYEEVIRISLADAKEKFIKLGVSFDDYRGEMYYNQYVPEVVSILEKANLLKDSEGAKIVDLSEYDMAPAIILKSDGTSIYTSRDLSAAINRYKDYHFDKMIYVTDVAQSLHFKQWFKIVELLGYDYAGGLEHLPYGRFSLPDGKISSRRGRQAVLVDLIEYASNKAKDIIKDRKFEREDPNNVVNKVTSAVLNYNVLKVERIKDCVFDVDKAFSFEGETAPYMQYTYTRIESIVRKYKGKEENADYTFVNETAFELVKAINDFKEVVRTSLNKRDSSLICKNVMEMCKTFNKFYTNTKVLDGSDKEIRAKINLILALKDVLKMGFNFICIDTLKEM